MIKILYADIETCPSLAWVWSTGKQYINHSQILEDTKIICIAYKWAGKSEKVACLNWDAKQCDKTMLKKFSKVVEEADVIIAHNGDNFDMKHINARIAFHKLPPLSLYTVSDSLKMSRKKFKLASHSLAYLAKYFGMGAKMQTGGIDLWLDIWRKKCAKSLAKMMKYCKNDVTLLEKVHQRIQPYIDSKINLNSDSDGTIMCPGCGGKVIKRGTQIRAGLKRVQIYQCTDCGKYSQDGINQLKEPKQYPR